MGQQVGLQAVERGVALGRDGENVRFGLDERSGDQFRPGVFDERAGRGGSGFEMELQADGGADLERLVFAGAAARQKRPCTHG